MRAHPTAGRSSRKRPLAPSWALLCLLTSACAHVGSRDDGPAVRLSFDPPPRVGASRCTIFLDHVDGAPVAGAEVEIEGNMNHAGMVPVFATAEELAPGHYQAPLEFTMGGDWFVIVRGSLADGREFERIVDVPAVPTSDGQTACCATDPR